MRKFNTGKWKGIKQYKCTECAYDTLDKDNIERHILERHTPVKQPKRVSIPVYDRFGNLIEEQEG